MSIEYGLVFTFFAALFDIPYSILFVQVTLFHFSKFRIIVATVCHYLVSAAKFFYVPKKTPKKKRLLTTKLPRI